MFAVSMEDENEATQSINSCIADSDNLERSVDLSSPTGRC